MIFRRLEQNEKTRPKFDRFFTLNNQRARTQRNLTTAFKCNFRCGFVSVKSIIRFGTGQSTECLRFWI